MKKILSSVFDAPTCLTYLLLSSLLSLLVLFSPSALAASSSDLPRPAIEWLKFQVPEAEQAHFLAKDQEIWTEFLQQAPGFISKEIWQDPTSPDTVIFVIRWSDRQHWKAIPEDRLGAIEAEFNQAVGQIYPMLEALEFRLSGQSG